MEILSEDLSKKSIEEIVNKRNELSMKIRQRNYLGQRSYEKLKREVQILDEEIEKRQGNSKCQDGGNLVE